MSPAKGPGRVVIVGEAAETSHRLAAALSSVGLVVEIGELSDAGPGDLVLAPSSALGASGKSVGRSEGSEGEPATSSPPDLDEAREANLYVATVSHEIRTPVSSLIGLTSMLARSDLPTEASELAATASAVAETLLRLVDQVLDFSKLEAGTLAFRPANFSVNELFSSLGEMHRPAAQERGLTLRFEVGEGVPFRLFGDSARLGQVLSNLVGNAVKFTSSGWVEATVELLELESERCRLRFVVEDSGPGIPDEHLQRVFEPFVRGPELGSAKGSGLGLAIARRLVRMMEGELTITSSRRKGTRVVVELPMRRPFEKTPAAATPFRLAGGSHRRILVVEDDEVNRRIAGLQVQRLGCEVEAVSNGREALEILRRQQFDLVLMDCQMPELDGYETTRRIRRGEGPGQHLPIVAVTAHAVQGDRERCLAAGMDDYIAKPYREETLGETMARWLAPMIPERPLAAESVPSRLDRERIETLAQLGRDTGEDVLTELCQLFVETGAERTEELRDLLAESELPRVAEVAHSLKGSSGNVGATDLQDLAARLEAAARAGNGARCRELLGRFERELRAVGDELKALVARSAPGENE